MTTSLAASKKRSLFFLAITATALSRVPFFLFDDPEGPNLLILTVAAVVVYAVSLLAYIFGASTSTAKKFWLALLIQFVMVTGFYFLGTR